MTLSSCTTPEDPQFTFGPAQVRAADLLEVDGVSIRLTSIIIDTEGAAQPLADWLDGKHISCVHFKMPNSVLRQGRCEYEGRDVADWMIRMGLGY
jgi:hypothetical protein